jgi:diguanylate cyclase (GGDEF)-like protein/PAS domain S-box-containing protein
MLPSRFARGVLGAVVFAALWGGAIAVISAVVLLGPEPSSLGTAITVTALFAALGALIPLSYARRSMQQVFVDLRAAIRRSDASGGAVASNPTGWADFDSLTAEMDKLARLRALRIEALIRQEARFRALADSSHGVEAWFSRKGALVWVSRSIERLSGYSRAECMLAPNLIELLTSPKDRPRMLSIAASALRDDERREIEFAIVRKDGRRHWIACHWRRLFGTDNRLLGLRVSVEDIQGRKDAELRLLDTVASLRRAQALQAHYLQRSDDERLRLVALLDTLRVGILFVDRDRRVYYSNRPMRAIWGFADDENLMGMSDQALIERTAPLRSDDDAYRVLLGQVLSQRGRSEPSEIPLRDGRVLEQVSSLVASEDGKRNLGRVWIFEDVTERRRAALRLIEMAERDALTNLLNRRRFHEELGRMLAEAARRHEKVGLLSFDLDGFKAINDRFGHVAGDEVLVEVSGAVAAIVRRNELLFRLGGDEFAILIPEAAPDDVATLARRINLKVSTMNFNFPAGWGVIGVSLGVAFYPDHAGDAEALIECADHAMYRAKAAGKNRVETYDGRLH